MGVSYYDKSAAPAAPAGGPHYEGTKAYYQKPGVQPAMPPLAPVQKPVGGDPIAAMAAASKPQPQPAPPPAAPVRPMPQALGVGPGGASNPIAAMVRAAQVQPSGLPPTVPYKASSPPMGFLQPAAIVPNHASWKPDVNEQDPTKMPNNANALWLATHPDQTTDPPGYYDPEGYHDAEGVWRPWGWINSRNAVDDYYSRALKNQKLGPAWESGLDTPKVARGTMYDQAIADQLAKINTDIGDQEKHALSVNEAEKQTALGQMANALGARGIGGSMAAFAPTTSTIQAQAGKQAADIVAGLQKQESEQNISVLDQLRGLGEAQSGQELAAEKENATNYLKTADLENQLQNSQLEGRRELAGDFAVIPENWRTVLDESNVSDGDRQMFADAYASFAQAQADPQVGPVELHAMMQRLLAMYSQYVTMAK